MCEQTASGKPAISIADATWLLALFLWDEAGSESVRVREALAATVSNQVRAWQRGSEPFRQPAAGEEADAVRALLFAACLDRDGRREGIAPPESDPVFASCRRIAQRAVNGALADPTGGAVRFHRLGLSPAWATSLEPGPLIGCFLFYLQDTEETGVNRPQRLLR